MKIFLLLLMLFSLEARAQDYFRIPDDPGASVITYLKNLKVKDASRQLGEKEKHELCRLFVKAFAISIRKQGMDSIMMTDVPVYRLLAANFPEIKAREVEGGSSIFLGTIVSFFNRMPEYRADVLQVLRQGIDRKNCRR